MRKPKVKAGTVPTLSVETIAVLAAAGIPASVLLGLIGQGGGTPAATLAVEPVKADRVWKLSATDPHRVSDGGFPYTVYSTSNDGKRFYSVPVTDDLARAIRDSKVPVKGRK